MKIGLFNFYLGAKTLEDKEIGEALLEECCKSKCMKKISYDFVHEKRAQWSTFGERKKTYELKKMLDGFQRKEKTGMY